MNDDDARAPRPNPFAKRGIYGKSIRRPSDDRERARPKVTGGPVSREARGGRKVSLGDERYARACASTSCIILRIHYRATVYEEPEKPSAKDSEEHGVHYSYSSLKISARTAAPIDSNRRHAKSPPLYERDRSIAASGDAGSRPKAILRNFQFETSRSCATATLSRVYDRIVACVDRREKMDTR